MFGVLKFKEAWTIGLQHQHPDLRPATVPPGRRTKGDGRRPRCAGRTGLRLRLKRLEFQNGLMPLQTRASTGLQRVRLEILEVLETKTKR